MRNIYDIIAEQKAFVDIKIASLEMDYIVEEFEYVQEGIGEGIKNMVKKIVDFIKMVIQKLREFIGKIFNFFKKGSGNGTDFVADADARIKQVNDMLSEYGKKEAEMQAKMKKAGEKMDKALDDLANKLKDDIEKNEKKNSHDQELKDAKLNIKFDGKADNLLGLLKIADAKVTTPNYGSIKSRIGVVEDLAVLGEIFEVFYQKIKKPEDFYNQEKGFMSNMIKEEVVGNRDANIQDGLRKKIGDGEGDITFVIKSKAEHIYGYMTDGIEFSKGMTEMYKDYEDEARKTIREIEIMGNNAANGKIKDPEKLIGLMKTEIERSMGTMNAITSFLGSSTLRAYGHYKAICNKVIDAYAAKAGKGSKAERRAERDKTYKTVQRGKLSQEFEDEMAEKYGY